MRASKDMASKFVTASMLFVFLHLAINKMDEKILWQVLDEACDVTKVYPNCSTLETVANKARENDSMEISINISQLTLASTLNFTKLKSLTINGVLDITTINCMNASAGIVLSDIAGTVELSNLRLLFCGSQVDYRNEAYTSALTIFGCKNVQLHRLVITRSHGLGLVILNHQGGSVNISFSNFAYNGPKMNNSERGGGILLKLDCVQSQNCDSMIFQFYNCTFANNTAYIPPNNSDHYCSHYYTVAMGNGKGFEHGGGVYVSIGGSASNISISFSRCEFSGNKACIGGGLMAKIHGEQKRKINQIRIEISDSKFYRNGYRDNLFGYGGGAHFMFDADLDESSISDCHYIIKNTIFISNGAANGGGVYFYSSKQAFRDNLIPNTLHFDGCTFENNVAYMGSAALMAPSTLFRLSTALPVTPVFRNSQFSSNTVRVYHLYYHKNEGTYGFGTVYVSSYTVKFQGWSHFQNNWGTSLYVVNGVIDFQKSNATFSNNTGLQGGAVALIGSSTMILGPNGYEFKDNSAIYQGGAIYVLVADKTDFTTSRCFLQYRDHKNNTSLRDWDLGIVFKGNKALGEGRGHFIHATSLHQCRIINNYKNGSLFEYSVLNFTQVFTERGDNITFEDDDGCQVATDGAILSRNDTSTLMIIPGEKYGHHVTIKDDLGHTVAPLFSVAIEPSHCDNISCPNVLSTFAEEEIELTGNCGESVTLIFQTLFPRQNHLKLNSSLVECPPGFKFEFQSKNCVCNVDAHLGLFKCDNNFGSYLFPGFWAGIVNLSDNNNMPLFVTSFNPYYTTPDNNIDKFRLPRKFPDAEFNKALCGSRTGIGCGICLNDSFSVHFNSPDNSCKPLHPFDCQLGWLFYILSELVPVTLLFMTVLVFNISFTSGTLNGFILFIQLLSSLDSDASGIIITNNLRIKHFSQIFQFFHGLLNLNFFNLDPLSFCLWKKATTLDMLSMKYVTILYVLILIMLVIWIMNKCGGKCFGKYCRIVTVKTSIVHGISTFFVICYAQCVRVSFNLIIPLHIHVEEYKEQPLRVWFNGELVYFGQDHLRYAIPALSILLTVGLLPPILLLSYPLINKILAILGLENHAIIVFISHKIPISSLKPLLDSFQGCFKDNLRFFAGLYFLYRWIILFSYTLIKDFTVYYPAVTGILIFILALHAICQPYIRRLHNITDALLFANLLLITAISSFNYNEKLSQVTKFQNATTLAVVQQVLICLPLVVMGVYIVNSMWKCIIHRGCLNKTDKAKKLIPGRAIRLKKFVRTISAENDSDLDPSEEDFTHDRLVDEDIEYREYNEIEHTQMNTTY